MSLAEQHGSNFDVLMDVSLDVTAEIGTARMKIADILKIGTGAIVTFDRSPQQPIDLVVNGRTIARGEIVAVDDRFGLRITELVSGLQ